MKKVILITIILVTLAVTANATLSFSTAWFQPSAYTGIAGNGWAYNPRTNNFYIANVVDSSPVGIYSGVSGLSTGQLAMIAGGSWGGAGIGVFAIAVDPESGAIYGNNAGGGLFKWATETSPVVQVSATFPGFNRTMTFLSEGTINFMYTETGVDGGIAMVVKSYNDGNVWDSNNVDSTPAPFCKSGMVPDGRTVDSNVGALTVFGMENVIGSLDPLPHKFIKNTNTAIGPSTWTDQDLTGQWGTAWLNGTLDTVLFNGLNMNTTDFTITNGEIDIPWGMLLYTGRNPDLTSETTGNTYARAYFVNTNSGMTVANGVVPIMMTPCSRGRPMISYLNASTHRFIYVSRDTAVDGGPSGAIAIDYTLDPTSIAALVPTLYTSPPFKGVSPLGSISIHAYNGVPPYSWSTVNALGGSIVANGPYVTYTAGSTGGTAILKVTDSGFQSINVNVTVLATDAPLAPEANAKPMDRKDVIRFDFFE